MTTNEPIEVHETTDSMRGRIVLASMSGTAIEFFDFFIYATAAVSVFPLLFFPAGEGDAALLASMATFGVAFIARPIGSVLFGHFGDRNGRKATLVGSLLLMGIATFLIGLLPTYQQIGLFAPALLTLLRFCQGLGLGGEWSGAALLVTETAKPGRRAWAAMWPQLGVPVGFILANGFFLLMTLWFNYDSTTAAGNHNFLVWGWRTPFLLSIVMVAIGLYVRLKLHETPLFAKAVGRGEKLKTPIVALFTHHFGTLMQGMFIMVATYGIFYLMSTWILSYAIGSTKLGFLGMDYRSFLVLQLVAVLFFALCIPIAAIISDRFGRRVPLLVTTAAIVIFGLSFKVFLAPETIGTGAAASQPTMLLFLSIGMGLMGLSFGPMSALLPELFPTNVRYTGSGVSYNLASIIGAALTPFVAAWLARNHGAGSVGYYLAFLGSMTFVALLLSEETRHRDLDTMADAEAILPPSAV